MSTDSIGHLPGMTRRVVGPADSVKPALDITTLPRVFDRPVVLIATANITDSVIYNNGLYQNVFLIYRLMESLGYLPIFIVNEKPKTLDEIPLFMRPCRVATVEDILEKPISIKLYLEIGMSISNNLRRYMKMLGGKTAKLYLGNIINIDIETPMFFETIHFSHHIVGEQDEIWTSPHYGQNAEYGGCINQITPVLGKSIRIAPYVWEPCILTNDGHRLFEWKPATAAPTFVIMEPNISFQKCGLVPLLAVEEYYRMYPTNNFKCIVLNGNRFEISGHYKSNIEPYLDCYKSGKVEYKERSTMLEVMKTYPSAIPICHHVNNEFNYMTLEYMSAGFPVLHNCEAWKDYGYYYPENDTIVAAKQLRRIIENHAHSLEAYKAQAKALFWRHSIYNPDVQTAWKELVESK